MEAKADRLRWTVDQDGTWLQLLMPDGAAARRYAEEHRDKPQRVQLTTWRKKRSLTANAYAWALLDKLSVALRLPAVEVYRQLIPDVGGNAIHMCIPLDGLEQLRRIWSGNGRGWLVDIIGVSDAPGMIDIVLYYGSSVYDTAQMARLIDLIIGECRENGIEHLPPDKINAMLEAWDAKKNQGAGDFQGNQADCI